MLRLLSIRDFVIVDTLDIEFDKGFTVFSGETGAGKSILVDALALVLGARGDSDIVRSGCARADITAEFELYDAPRRWLIEHAFDTQSDAPTVMLRRVVDSHGRSRAFVNGVPATLTQLRELGEMLVDIHGQHAHQLLMRAEAQRQLFDAHAGLEGVTRQVAQAWQNWRAAREAIEAARQREREVQLEREQLAWQVSELEALAPQAGEWEEIGHEQRRLAHAANLLEGVHQAIDGLSEADDGAMLAQLSPLVARLRELVAIDEGLAEVVETLESAQIQIQESVYSLNHYVQRVDLDPARLAEVEARLGAMHTLARKFRLDPASLHIALDERRERLQVLDAAADLNALVAAEAQAQRAYMNVAEQLSKARASAAAPLAAAVTTGMQELSMVGGSFEVALLPLEHGGAHGLEQIEFRVAGHPGVPRRPLSKVASGGELARISLALAVIASSASPVPTLIFDEVDTGIGGAVAEVVGRLLSQLGQIRQVLCVTHLPQVAARGDAHFRVAKMALDGEHTVSTVQALKRAERIEEIARMLGGIEITATTRRHAKEMLTA